MVREYAKKLTFSEAEYYYVRIAKKAREMFPSPGRKIDLYHENKRFKTKIDRFNRIWIGKLRLDFSIKEGETIVISKEAPPETYSISKR